MNYTLYLKLLAFIVFYFHRIWYFCAYFYSDGLSYKFSVLNQSFFLTEEKC